MRRANIVLLRGTSGSGKTYIAEQVFALLGQRGRLSLSLGPATRVKKDGTEVPVDPATWKTSGYVWADQGVSLLGRYGDTACGGCDAMSWPGGADDIERQALEQVSAGRRVLMEGLIVASWGVPRYQRIHERSGGLLLINLTTPLEQCLESVRARRVAAGNTKPLNPENTISKYEGFLKSTGRLAEAGLWVEELSRDYALAAVRWHLGLDT